MADDAVVGVTSNPTIFQKALAEGDLYDEQLREVAAATDDPIEIFFALAHGRHPRGVRPDAAPSGSGPAGIDGWVSLEVDPTLAYDRERTFEQAVRFNKEVDRAEPLRQDPRHEARPRRDRGLHREGRLDQRHADLLARALRGGRRGVPPRPRAARRRRRRPAQGAVGRELLRLPRRHRGRQAAGGGRPARPPGQARDREREARLPALPRRVRAASAGTSSPGRARGRSAACGRRPRRRTPPTAT